MAVTPRRCSTRPSESNTGSWTNEWSSRKPVAQITALTGCCVPSAKLTVASCAPVTRGRRRMPCLRARRGLEPISVSRSLRRCASRESTVLAMAQSLEVVEHVAAQGALGQRGLAGANGQVDLVNANQLFGDLIARVAPADDDHRSVGQLLGPAVAGAVQLRDLRREP